MTVVLYPDDTGVREFYPTTNFNTSQNVVVGDDTGDRGYILDEYDLSSESTSLVSAKLNIYVHEAHPAMTIYVRRITTSWTPSTVTWNTKPSYTTTNQTSFTTSYGVAEWHIIDVTQIIKDCINSGGYGLQLMADSSDTGDNGFWTVDYTTDPLLRPFLEINYGDKYVDIATGSDSDDGNSWANAYLTIKKGLDNYVASSQLHIAEGDYSAQAAIDLNKNLELLCEDYGGGVASPPLTVTLPPTT